jgi:glycosyltransferase involved in cell wall biosynthesis
MKDALPSSAPISARRVLISSYRSNPHVGGQGIYVRQLARALKALGCAVTVVSGPPYPELDPDITLEALPSLNLFAVENAFLAFKPSFLNSKADRTEWLAHNTFGFGEMTSFALRLEHFIADRGDEFDVMIDNQTLSLPMVRIAQQIPLVTTLHHPIAIDREFAISNAPNWWRAILASRWHSFVRTQAKAVKALPHFLAVSEASRDHYAEICGLDPSRAEIGFNGINHNNFYVDPAILRDENHIVAVASADVPVKGLDVLIKSLAHLRRKGITPKLTVVGSLREGPTKTVLVRERLTEQVEFVSGLSDEDIAGLFRRASVFVSPSRFEGFGFPPAEAMACGAPVIASNGGALPEVVGDAGKIVPVEDEIELADAIESVLGNDALRSEMSRRSAERALSAFRWSHHGEVALELCERAISEHARSGASTS